MNPQTQVCHCPAYRWPHRRASGKCIWNPKNLGPLCEECGSLCKPLLFLFEPEDGKKGWYYESSCCGAPVVSCGEELVEDEVRLR